MRSSPIPVAVVATVAALVLFVSPVAGQSGMVCVSYDAFGCAQWVPAAQVPEETGSTGSNVPVDFDYYFDEDGIGVDAEEGYEVGCWGIQVVPEGEGGTWAEAVEGQNAQGVNGVLWGNCEVEETIDPVAVAGQMWQRAASPPPPTPLRVANGKIATGLPAYLEIGGDIPAVEAHSTPIGVLTFTMIPRYVVSWGDGATTPTTSQGGSREQGGDVTHVYRDAGDLTITVDAYWHATWTLAGAGGDLPELAAPTSSSLDLLVEQFQAVTD